MVEALAPNAIVLGQHLRCLRVNSVDVVPLSAAGVLNFIYCVSTMPRTSVEYMLYSR